MYRVTRKPGGETSCGRNVQGRTDEGANAKRPVTNQVHPIVHITRMKVIRHLERRACTVFFELFAFNLSLQPCNTVTSDEND